MSDGRPACHERLVTNGLSAGRLQLAPTRDELSQLGSKQLPLVLSRPPQATSSPDCSPGCSPGCSPSCLPVSLPDCSRLAACQAWPSCSKLETPETGAQLASEGCKEQEDCWLDRRADNQVIESATRGTSSELVGRPRRGPLAPSDTRASREAPPFLGPLPPFKWAPFTGAPFASGPHTSTGRAPNFICLQSLSTGLHWLAGVATGLLPAH